MVVQGNQEEMKLNKTHELLVYADDVNLLEENINATRKAHKLYLTLLERVNRKKLSTCSCICRMHDKS
jgi:hypothetical protein